MSKRNALPAALENRYRDRAELLRLLGHPTRVAILATLAPGPKCVSDIGELLDAAQPNLSQHLAALRAAGVVDFYRDGRLRCYYISMPEAAELVLQLVEAECRIVRYGRDAICTAAKTKTRGKVGPVAARATRTVACCESQTSVARSTRSRRPSSSNTGKRT